MDKATKKRKKLPYGYCKQVADIVGTDKYYVSKVLSSPDTFKGPQAELIKSASIQLNKNIHSLRAEFNKAQ
jgi:hypothetical protein